MDYPINLYFLILAPNSMPSLDMFLPLLVLFSNSLTLKIKLVEFKLQHSQPLIGLNQFFQFHLPLHLNLVREAVFQQLLNQQVVLD